MGLVWALNMIFILAPSNHFFPTFQSVALSFAPTSLGGPAVADFVAAHWFVFAWITAVLTGYLPGLSVIRFTVDLINPGSFGWFCVVPCGAGANPYSSPPMGVPGYMTGTMTIT